MPQRVAFAFRIAARVWSVASTLFILPFATSGGASLTANEAVSLLFFPIGVIVGFAIAWWREGLGGSISVGSLAAFYGWMTAVHGRPPAGPYFLLLGAPGFLFLVAALLRHGNPGAGRPLPTE